MSPETNIPWAPVVVEWGNNPPTSISTSPATTGPATSGCDLPPSPSQHVQSQASSHVESRVHAHVAEFRLFFESSSNIAAFMLRAPVNLRGLTKAVDKSFVYLMVNPERVLSLVHSNSSKPPARDDWVHTRTAKHNEKNWPLSPEATGSLRFTLASPTPLIGHSPPLIPKSPADRKVLDSLHSLATMTDLTVHISSGTLPDQPLMSQICEAASTAGLLKSSPHMDITTLYRGEKGGGKVVAVPGQVGLGRHAGRDDDEQADPGLPSYEDLDPPPPHALEAAGTVSSKKRPRTSSGPEDIELHRDVHVGMTDASFRVAFESQFAQRLPEVRRQLLEDVTGEMRRQLDQVRSQILDSVDTRLAETEDARRRDTQQLMASIQEACASLRAEMSERVQHLEADSRSQNSQGLEKQVQDLSDTFHARMEELEDQLAEMSGHLEGEVHEQIDECRIGLRVDLEDFVHDEVLNAQEQIENGLREGRYNFTGTIQLDM